jgi:predicted tellurium resistance membrane protein TerC
MFDWMLTTDGLVAFLTLFAMEVVLGIDNIVFISILAAKLPVEQQARARYIGLGLALFMRLGLLFAITWIMGLTKPLVSLLGHEFTGRDLVLLGGGLFLIAKATIEIHHTIEGGHEKEGPAAATFGMVVAQIVAIDIVFSLDSIITAVGLTQDIGIMIAAVLCSMAVMLLAAGPVSDFVQRHPTTKMLALAFLVLIGTVLVANGFGVYVPKGYVYSAMAFSVIVEMLNVTVKNRRARASAVRQPVSGAALESLLSRALRHGARQVQLAGEEGGGVRAWFVTGTGLVEDKALDAAAWRALKAEIEDRAKHPLTLEGAKHLLSAAMSPPNQRPAALLTLQRA